MRSKFISRIGMLSILYALLLLVLMSVFRILFFFVFVPRESSYSWSPMILGLRYDARMVSIPALLLLLLGSIRALSPFGSNTSRAIWIFCWTFFSIIIVLFYVFDFAHYAYLAQRLDASVLNYLEDLGLSSKMVWENYPVIWILIITVLLSILINWCFRRIYNRISQTPRETSKKISVYSFIVGFLLFGVSIFGRIGQYPLRWSDAFEFADNFKASVALNPFQSFFSSLHFRHSNYSIDKVKRHYPWMASYLGIRNPDDNKLDFIKSLNPAADLRPKPNVVLVICESFSLYKSTMSGSPLNATPFFDTLCRQGIYFSRCFTPSYGTARGVWATITGIPDVSLPTTASRNPLIVDQHTIINDFEGYDKSYFIGGSSSWANIRGLLKNNIAGLHLYEQNDYAAPAIDVWGISDKNLFLEANKMLRKKQTPFFAVIQTADNHRPYTIPEEDRAAFKPVTVNADSLHKYGFDDQEEFNAFCYTDFCYQRFFEAASKERYFNNTIFIFVGDHGIAGDATHLYPPVWTDQHLTNEHVPLLIYSPALLKPNTYSFPCSQIDILPTVVGICKIPYQNTTLGRDLLDSERLARDSGQSNCAFIFDYALKQIGVIYRDHYYTYSLATKKTSLSAMSANEVSSGLPYDSIIKQYHGMAESFYETAGYLFFHNKKK